MKKLLLFVSVVLALIYTGCAKEYSLENAAIVPATGTLKDSSGNCPTVIEVGDYFEDSVMTDSNLVLVPITIFTPGTYRVVTNQANGVRFADSGYFATPGQKVLRLRAFGKSQVDTIVTYTFQLDTSICSFSIEYFPKGFIPIPIPSTINLADSAWSFNIGNDFYHGPFDATVQLLTITTPPPAPPLTTVALSMAGSTFDTGDTLFVLTVGNTTGAPITTKDYNSNYQNGEGCQASFTDAGATPTPLTIFTAGPNTTGVNLITTVTSFNTTTRIIEGTFTGTARGPNNSVVNVTNGRFRAEYR